MPDFDWIIAGGFVAGAVAGGAARFGKLCTMSAIEDALVGHDYRGLKAWGLAVGVAIIATQLAALAGWIDIGRTLYLSPRLHLLGTIAGGALFGLGMTLVGTCGFGLLVRAGGGDLRAAASAVTVGVFAIAVTAGLLAPLRIRFVEFDTLDASGLGGASLASILGKLIGQGPALAAIGLAVAFLVVMPFRDARLRRRPRLLAGAAVMGLSVAIGWFATTRAMDALTLDRPESLSFVAPVGRALLQFMMEPFRNAGFGVAAMFGVLAASLAVAVWRDELRWEAFDDPIEMRRHVLGGALMGIGGVLAQGCTIGQGLSAASTLAVTAPLFVASVFLGAKAGLLYLIEGRSLWRLGRSQRYD